LLFLEIESSHILKGLHVVLGRNYGLEDGLFHIGVHVLLASKVQDLRVCLFLLGLEN
jgi:hypothetical protein